MNLRRIHPWVLPILFIIAFGLSLIGCSSKSVQEATAVTNTTPPPVDILTIPELDALELQGQPLKVVATTSIIGDIVAQVGGDAIELTTLIGPGQDPHSYKPGAQELTAVAEAHIIFVNGWDLEESLVHDLENIVEDVPLVAISANITPLTLGNDVYTPNEEGQDEHAHSGADPHVWFNINNVKKWVENARQVFSDLDPVNATVYESNAQTYLAELELLESDVEKQIDIIPKGNRLLVTNHDSLSYFAKVYEFELLGTVIPAASTVAEPSASDLADLIAKMDAHGLCTIFTETSVSDSLAQTVTAELKDCADVQVLTIYTGTLGPLGSSADSYLGMFRANVDMIVAGLQNEP